MKSKMNVVEKIYGISSSLYDENGKSICVSSQIKDSRHFNWLKEYKIDLSKITLVIHHTKLGAVIIPIKNQYLVLGNMFIGKRNEHRLWIIKQQMSKDEEIYFNRLPEISLSELKKLCFLISQWFSDGVNDFVVIENEAIIKKDVQIPNQEEIGLLENYQLQKKMMECIKQGQAEMLYQLMKYEKFYVRNFSLSEQKNNFIKLSSLVSQALFEGGLGLYETDLLINSYLKQLENMNDESKIHTLQKEMLLGAVNAVKLTSTKVFKHPLNRKVNEYLQIHLHESIHFSEMADDLNVSKNYMLSTFKKEAGVSLVNYMYSLKIKEAILLMNQGDLTISQISAYLGFSSHSYFSKWFKVVMGMTPKEYLNR